MRRTVLACLATATVAALSATPWAPAVASDVDRHGSGGAVQAQVWVTTPDRAQLLAPQAPVTFAAGASDLTTIVVDPDQRFQTMDGFGASITDSSASLLAALPQAQRDEAMRSLFDPASGIGVSFLRQPVGSSDFTAAAEHYTFDDVAPGATDFPLEHFSHRARRGADPAAAARRPSASTRRSRCMATPWSPPAWMKTGDSLVGGRLKDDPAVYDAYARYLVKFVQAYTAAGVPIDFLSVQNEPQNRTPDAYPGTDMPVAQQEKVILALGPLLRKASPRTQILGYDHNWQTHPNDVANTPPGEDPATDYPYQLLVRAGREVDRRHRVPLLLRRPQRADRPARGVPEEGHLVHRVLRLARPDGHPGADLPRHADLARPDASRSAPPATGRSRW